MNPEQESKSLVQNFVEMYRKAVEGFHPDMVAFWPLFGSYNTYNYLGKNFYIAAIEDTGRGMMFATSGMPDSVNSRVEAEFLAGGKSRAKAFVRKALGLNARSFVIIISTQLEGDSFLCNVQEMVDEMNDVLEQHRTALGVSNNKIFLSHKGVDKSLVRDFKSTLDALGFLTWLDEDAMPAGTSLEKGILSGFKDSCAVVFFVTPNFRDEGFLETEVEYAIRQKKRKGDAFQIITLVFNSENGEIDIPELLKTYVYKHPRSHLEALREIMRALPVKVGEVAWK